jgi:type IV pilus assembly protein PilO
LPSKAEMDALLSDINQAGIGRSLQFELFRPGQVVVKDYYAELPIAVRVTGRYHDIGAFAADIANLSRIVTINNITIVPGKDGALAMDATAKTFRYLDAEEVAAQRARPRGRPNEFAFGGYQGVLLVAVLQLPGWAVTPIGC